MKNKFNWCINPSSEELDSIWNNGVLTVDTNVLLDLYRYHEDTRQSLLRSLETFKGKKWLSHQAATEFFRNRAKVIISSEKAFNQAQDETEKLNASLKSAVAQLKGNRIIPSVLANDLDAEIGPPIAKALLKISEAREKYPKFLEDDTILKKLLELFDGAVGEDFSEQDKGGIEAQAEQRKRDKIPPGYLDDGKDDDRPYGDYYLWLQVLQHAKAEGRPIILVTSERKKDWWEEISGKTVGTRPEMLREAREFSGQRILIYQTERFLKHALSRSKQPVNELAIEEIRAISRWRLDSEAAVKLHEHTVVEATVDRNKGMLTVELLRQVRNFTVSGRFEPHMHEAPVLSAKLMSSPEELPIHRINAGTGTSHNFNIHIVSSVTDSKLPVGIYVFEYEAIIRSAIAEIEEENPRSN